MARWWVDTMNENDAILAFFISYLFHQFAVLKASCTELLDRPVLFIVIALRALLDHGVLDEGVVLGGRDDGQALAGNVVSQSLLLHIVGPGSGPRAIRDHDRLAVVSGHANTLIITKPVPEITKQT